MTEHHTPDHGNRAHARLSASGAKRWLNCPASTRLEAGFEDKGSTYADEGTLAHEIAEHILQAAVRDGYGSEYEARMNEYTENPLYYNGMISEVERYTDYVKREYIAAEAETSDAKILIEQRVNLTEFIPEGFGTCDAIIIADGVIEVCDLKFGKGVPVYAENNEQLMLYGVGALRAYELMYDIRTVRLTIVQPRLDNISSWDIEADALRTWADEYVKPRAIAAYNGEGEPVPGDHCRWCKAKPRCKALAQMAQHAGDFTAEAMPDPVLLTDAELVEAYTKVQLVQTWLSAVDEYLLTEAVKGRKFPGLKLVEGRSNRTFTDAQSVEAVLFANQFPQSKYMSEPKLQGITAIESLVGKKRFDELLGQYVTKPPGKPTLVPESDKRPEYVKTSVGDFEAD